MILFIIFAVVEIIYILYTVKFGLKDSFEQPPGYTKIKNVFPYLRYVIIIIFLLNRMWFIALILLLIDYFISKIIFSFCKKRAIKNMVRMLTGDGKTEKELGTKPMELEDARRVAPEIVEQNIKSGSYII